MLKLFTVVALLALVRIASGQTTQPGTAAPSTTEPTTLAKAEGKVSVTAHEITVNGQKLAYHATAGGLTLKDDDGKPKANVFFVAYEKDIEATGHAARPITFLFNGGPGAAAVWLHLGGVGPKCIEFDDHDLPVGPPYRLIDNTNTWLADSDLVFIDPVSTGFSRAAPGEKAEQFHGVRQDIASVAEFIRLYITRYQRWASPKFIAGESYGTTRAAAIVRYLAERYGIDINAMVLVSSVLDFQTILPAAGNDLPYVLYLPSYTAVAAYHDKIDAKLKENLPATLKAVEDFALADYGPALALGSALPVERRTEIIRRLSTYTGLPADVIERADLRIEPGYFQKHLLGDGRQIIGRFDGRIIGTDADALANQPAYDPSLTRYFPAYSSTFNDYVRRELKFESDLPYEVLTSVQPWSFGHESGGYLYVIDELQQAIRQHPHLKVLFVSGRYDLATPFATANYAINRLQLSGELRKNVAHVYFETGHMVYHNAAAAKALAQVVAKFIKG